MRSFLVFFFILKTLAGFASVQTDSLFEKLRNEAADRFKYDFQKNRSIQKIKSRLNMLQPADIGSQYSLCLRLYDQYKSYQYDSAYIYAVKLQSLSLKLKDRQKEDYSKIKLGFILLSAGMFKETFDELHGIYAGSMPDTVKVEYYSIMTRAYYDLATYDNDKYFQPYYKSMADRYIDSALALSKPGSYDNIYLNGFKRFKNNRADESASYFIELLSSHHLTTHQEAIVSSTLSNIYLAPEKQNERIALLVRAALADIRSSTKETLAMFWLSELLYKSGDIKNAYYFLQLALADADFYGARQRKVQIGTLLPIVSAEKVKFIEGENGRVLIYLGLITGLALMIIVFAFILFIQLRNLKIKEKVIDDKNNQLKQFNEELIEGAHIKEEYIGNFFNLISDYILQLETIKRTIGSKLHLKKYEEIQLIIDKIYIKKEREKLFNTFDTVFLKIFPNFIESFNSLFKPEDQTWPKEEEVLTTDLRIFALIRIGIGKTETIAHFLEYSEKTIYVYKMKMKAKSIDPEHFDQQLMAIKAFGETNEF